MGKVANYMTSSARLRGLALSRCCKRQHQQERPRYKRVTPVQRVEDDADRALAAGGFRRSQSLWKSLIVLL